MKIDILKCLTCNQQQSLMYQPYCGVCGPLMQERGKANAKRNEISLILQGLEESPTLDRVAFAVMFLLEKERDR